MAVLLKIVATDADGGLATLLKEARVPEPAVKFLTGVGPTDLGMENMADFFNSFSSKDFEAEIEKHFKDAKLEGLEEARMLNQAVARTRYAFRSAAAGVAAEAAAAAPSASAAPPALMDIEAPLADKEKEDLLTAWKSRYSFSVQSKLMGSDTLVSRTYREWRNRTPTVPAISKIRNQTSMLKPSRERREQLTKELSIVRQGLNEEDFEYVLDTIYDYYVGVRILVNVWAYVGNFNTASAHDPSKQVRMMDYEEAANYADDSLERAIKSGIPASRQVAWYQENDEATRTTMMEKMRLGWPAVEALKFALDFHRQDWRRSKVSFAPAPHHSPRRGRSRSVSAAPPRRGNRSRSRGGKGAGKVRRQRTDGASQGTRQQQCISLIKGGKKLCAKFNRGQCREPCPNHDIHECNLRLDNGQACRQKHCRVGAHGR